MNKVKKTKSTIYSSKSGFKGELKSNTEFHSEMMVGSDDENNIWLYGSTDLYWSNKEKIKKFSNEWELFLFKFSRPC